MCSFSGEGDVCKSKGFSLHSANQQVYNFETLNDQKEKLVMHTNETITRKFLFDIKVQKNSGKQLNLAMTNELFNQLAWVLE